MCKQKAVIAKIQKAGKLNGFAIELSEAQMQDYLMLKHDVDSVKTSVNAIKKEQKKHGEILAKLGGQIDLIVNRLNSPIEAERKDAIFWQQIKSIAKTPTGKIIIILMLGCVAMAGDKILQLIGLIK